MLNEMPQPGFKKKDQSEKSVEIGRRRKQINFAPAPRPIPNGYGAKVLDQSNVHRYSTIHV
jgi:hypothetical protein